MTKWTDWFDYFYNYDLAKLTNWDTGNWDTYWFYYMTKWTDWSNYDYDYGFAELTNWDIGMQ